MPSYHHTYPKHGQRYVRYNAPGQLEYGTLIGLKERRRFDVKDRANDLPDEWTAAVYSGFTSVSHVGHRETWKASEFHSLVDEERVLEEIRQEAIASEAAKAASEKALAEARAKSPEEDPFADPAAPPKKGKSASPTPTP